jgi:hypothetical protein
MPSSWNWIHFVARFCSELTTVGSWQETAISLCKRVNSDPGVPQALPEVLAPGVAPGAFE